MWTEPTRRKRTAEERSGGAARLAPRRRSPSGWRGKAYQRRLPDEAVEKYGSYDEALRWVNTPSASTHVTGDAVDIGPTDAAYWMSQHGYAYGLCQVRANEIWHYELIVEPGGVCPPPV